LLRSCSFKTIRTSVTRPQIDIQTTRKIRGK